VGSEPSLCWRQQHASDDNDEADEVEAVLGRQQLGDQADVLGLGVGGLVLGSKLGIDLGLAGHGDVVDDDGQLVAGGVLVPVVGILEVAQGQARIVERIAGVDRRCPCA
jgi:hypothetical protein